MKPLSNPKTSECPASKRLSQDLPGFALIATLTMMVLLLILALGMLSLSTVALRSGGNASARQIAQSNARMALMLALGELQKAAGPDQRVTAGSSILANSSSNAPVDGRRHWTGVWNTATYNPRTPDTKPFVRWLVSSPDTTQVTNIQFAAGVTSGDAGDHTIFTGDSAENNVVVPKVATTDSLGNPGSYAYWVEDEGIKADLSWNEGKFSDSIREQAARMSAAPGPDYQVFGGPFETGVSHPISQSTSATLVKNLDKAISPADIPAVMSSASHENEWLQENRHDITLGSRGVMADAKLGGLRRDLSLAFEMDGDADFTWNGSSLVNPPTKFNAQTGEFVAGNDRLSGDYTGANVLPKGFPVKERLLWRDKKGSGTPFSDMIGTDKVVRGPNWWALRDYANLYKRLSGSGGNYTMGARASFPNRSSETLALSDYYSMANAGGNGFDLEHCNPSLLSGEKTSIGTTPPGSNDYYIYRHARANYVPVNLGTSILVSILTTNPNGTKVDVAVGLDPLFYFWNPYNRKIRVENLAVSMGNGFAGNIRMWVDDGTTSSTYTSALADMLKANLSSSVGNKINFLIKGPIVLEPGEVVIASPTATEGEAVLGYSGTSNSSGIILKKVKNVGTNKNAKFEALTVNVTDKIGFNHMEGSQDIVAIRHERDVSLPAAGTTVAEITADLKKLGEHTQNVWVPKWAGSSGMAEYVSPAAGTNAPIRTESANNLLNNKVFFGAQCLLTKPASAGGKTPNPYEMFSRFNPAASIVKRQLWAAASYSHITRHITANSDFAVRDEAGIDFSGSTRGTFWGLSYQSTGSTSVPLSEIPSTPLFSLAAFANANLSIMDCDPYRAVGNSWSSPLLSPTSVYAKGKGFPGSWGYITVQDYSWLINDALFDRYYLSGIAPDFDITGSGYSAKGTLTDTLNKFFDTDSDPATDYRDAKANPVLTPYLPTGTSAAEAVTALSADDGYKKMGAYSLIDGAFNVNSTSVAAWEAFLRANRNLDVSYANGGKDSSNGAPFPKGTFPAAPGNGAKPQWSGLSRLTDDQISALAIRIVEQVKLRGPFMSISDFVNHRVGDPLDPKTSYAGALQAALDLESGSGGSGINAASRAAAANSAAVDVNAQNGTPVYPNADFDASTPVGKTTAGIPGDITQADLLLPLAPRLAARSDTFRIRAYGEALASDGFTILASATCEAVVQRVPAYMDTETDAANNEPWDEAKNPYDLSSTTSALNKINQDFGRRFVVVGFRWLAPDES
ncbi:MAG: hypothetical protein ABJQ29_06940 [Luteolibacter sp.]